MSNNLNHQYSEAVDYLDDKFAYFLTHVLNIGSPRPTGVISTAAVSVPLDKDPFKDYHFIFNPQFADKLNTEEMAFVLAHETMHILLNHLRLFQSPKFDDKQRLNIAADCVINDYLVANMGFNFPVSIDGCRGEEIVGFNCANATVREVYDKVPPSPPCDGSCQPGGGGQPCDGSCGKGQHPLSDKVLDDHDWLHGASQAEQDKADETGDDNNALPADLERTKDDDDFQTALPPGTGIGDKVQFMQDNAVSLKWASLLEEIHPFMYKHGPKPRAAWHRTPRKLAGMPQTRLPVHERASSDYQGRNKPAIVMALDTSMSIGAEQSNQFVNMARSVPQHKIHLFVCTFTTAYQELDLDNPQWNSGGTAFDPISQYIEDIVIPNNHKKYPSAVVVVSDLDASFGTMHPDEKQSKSWWWLSTRDDNTTDYLGNPLPGQFRNLSDYMVTK
jgi:hypothetical protein